MKKQIKKPINSYNYNNQIKILEKYNFENSKKATLKLTKNSIIKFKKISIPNEITTLIFSFLHKKDLQPVLCTNKGFRKITQFYCFSKESMIPPLNITANRIHFDACCFNKNNTITWTFNEIENLLKIQCDPNTVLNLLKYTTNDCYSKIKEKDTEWQNVAIDLFEFHKQNKQTLTFDHIEYQSTDLLKKALACLNNEKLQKFGLKSFSRIDTFSTQKLERLLSAQWQEAATKLFTFHKQNKQTLTFDDISEQSTDSLKKALDERSY